MRYDAPKVRRLYTRQEVADRLGVAAATVTRWCKEGRFPSATRTIGGHRRWDAETVDAIARGEIPVGDWR